MHLVFICVKVSEKSHDTALILKYIDSLYQEATDKYYSGHVKVVLVGLLVSGSHDSGDIVCNLIMLFADILFVDIRYAPRGCGRFASVGL